jgi:CheY-like chemotaxis protein
MITTSKLNVILLADDDADDRLLTQDALAESQLSADLHFVENGTELLDYLLFRGKFTDPASAPRPQLILLDLNMPRMDGREVLQKIKAEPTLRRIPIVVLTTSRADTDIARIYDLGANSFITKPVRFEALVNVMKTLRLYWFETVELPASK